MGAVILGDGKKAKGYLVCDACKAESKKYPCPTVAPELDVCEAAEKDGWSYSMGFLAMFLGHTCLCPACTTGKRLTP